MSIMQSVDERRVSGKQAAVGLRTAAAPTSPLNFEALAIPEDMLQSIRRDIYHSSGLGYHVFRGFLSPSIAEHMRRFWTELEPTHVHKPLPSDGVKALYQGCPDYFYGSRQGDHRGYLNFFWNSPADEVSYAVAMQVQWLRNRIMGRTPYEDIFPLRGRSVSYRTVISMRGKVVTRVHRDFDGDEWIREPARLQGTLFLSTPAVDYTGDGFILETNTGGRVRFGHEVQVANGDLVLWRYCNEHAVLNVESSAEQCGFIRMLFPTEEVPAGASLGRSTRLLPNRQALLQGLKGTALGRRLLVPLWHRMRGR